MTMTRMFFRLLNVCCFLSVFTLLVGACGSTDDSGGSDTGGADASGETGSDAGGGDAASDLESDDTTSDIFVDIFVEENFRSVLSAIVIVETSEAVECFVEYGPDTQYGLMTGTSSSDTEHEITVVQMRAATEYHMRVGAITDAGNVYSEDFTFTTGTLPSDIPSFSVIIYDASMQPGITLFGPGMAGREHQVSPYYLGVDEAGAVVWYYRLEGDVSRFNDRDVVLLDDGNLLIMMENGFAVITIGGDILLDVTSSDYGYQRFHHDVSPMPGGGFMVLAEETKQVDISWDASPDPVAVTGDLIVEIDADGEVVWEWSAFDHIDNDRFPTSLSRQTSQGRPYDWTHSNSVTYLEDDNSVLVSVRHQHWVIKIDHVTGDIIWALGDDGDFTLSNGGGENTWFYAEHAPEIQPDGTIMIYDNGNDRPSTSPRDYYSRAVIYDIDTDAGTAEQVWAYTTEYFTNFLGDADGLDNGNVLICAGGQQSPDRPAQIVEVTRDADPQMVWRLEMHGYNIYRATRLDSLYGE